MGFLSTKGKYSNDSELVRVYQEGLPGGLRGLESRGVGQERLLQEALQGDKWIHLTVKSLRSAEGSSVKID